MSKVLLKMPTMGDGTNQKNGFNRGNIKKMQSLGWGCQSEFTLWSFNFYVDMRNSVSSVVEIQRWWVLKSKIFALESTCSKEILIPSTLNYLWSAVVGVVKVDYLDFPCEIFEILCEFDVRVIACNF